MNNMNNNKLPYKQISDIINETNRSLFPISWLNKQEYCEYQIYLENIKGIKVEPTKAMIEGKQEHGQLYDEFKKEAVPATVEEMLDKSKQVEVYSREFRVVDNNHGVYGLIDEVLLTPDEFIVIDDKPGRKTYLSNIRQVYGYCLAFKEIIKPQDSRNIVAALRERGTDDIFWTAPFDQLAEHDVVGVINHIHGLLTGSEEFSSSDNPNKCKVCRFKGQCDRALLNDSLV
jgi:CRISPR/Cas system-associated exonuclease Cas4 (RecB family)